MIGQRPAKPHFKAYTDVILFGKYKGHTVEWLMDNDVDYLIWALENDVCTASDEIKDDVLEIYYAEQCDDYTFPDLYDMYGDDD